ncbi:glutamine synthetase family protein [Marmoricola sp. URHA0025 HA25]
MLTVEDLRGRIGTGDVDTVVVAFTDMQGRLQGKRLHGQYFVDFVLGHGTEGCNYLLAVDIDMNTVDGYAISSWEQGYGDMEFVLDLSTIRLLPHLPGTAMVQCDLAWPDGRPVVQSPRAILARQVERAAEAGFIALAGTELEFILFDATYEEAWSSGYRDLQPSNQYNVDYSILGTTRVEPLLRDIRNTTYAAGMNVEGAKGECNFGQHEVGFLYDNVVVTADNHAVYKTMAKEIASQHGKALTFMAKYNEREGNSCHIHLSLRASDGTLVFGEDAGRSPVYDHFIAGLLATMREFTLLYAPNVNSYKRFAAGSFAPTAIAWGLDNRTCAIRLVGTGPSARLENRVPGGDVNPVPGDRRDARRRPPRRRRGAAAGAGARRQCVRLGQAARPLHAVGGARRVPRLGDRAEPARRRGRRALHEHGRRRARRVRRRGDRLGAAANLRTHVRSQ